jgi:hypothetical protein
MSTKENKKIIQRMFNEGINNCAIFMFVPWNIADATNFLKTSIAKRITR